MERLRARVIRQHRIDAQSAGIWHMVGLESTTGDRSRLDAVESHRMMPMATRSSNLSESRLIPRDGFSCASVCVAPSQASADSLESIGSIVINGQDHPYGNCETSRHRLALVVFGTIRVPIGSKIEFCFQRPTYLPALYNVGVRESGETSIDGIPSSLLG